MGEQQIICPACFQLIPLSALICPYCKADIALFSARDYADKLIAALNHPLSEIRMRVIIALGWRREERVVRPLLALALRHPVDIVEGVAVAECLAKLGADGQAALIKLMEQHPAHTVRETAMTALCKSTAEVKNGKP